MSKFPHILNDGENIGDIYRMLQFGEIKGPQLVQFGKPLRCEFNTATGGPAPPTFDELRAIAEKMPKPPKPTNFEEAVAAGYSVHKINGELYAVDMKQLYPYGTR